MTASGEPGDGLYETLRMRVSQDQCDRRGRLMARYYMDHFNDATFSMMVPLGLGPAQARELGVEISPVRVEVDFHAEILSGEVLRCLSGFEGISPRQLTYRHRIVNADGGTPLASARVQAVCVGMQSRRVVEIPPAVLELARGHLLAG